jgi:hypothetical protein
VTALKLAQPCWIKFVELGEKVMKNLVIVKNQATSSSESAYFGANTPENNSSNEISNPKYTFAMANKTMRNNVKRSSMSQILQGNQEEIFVNDRIQNASTGRKRSFKKICIACTNGFSLLSFYSWFYMIE